MRHIALALVVLLMTPLAHADGLQMKEIRYDGGVVRFSIPKNWVEEYEPDGGVMFYGTAPNTGILRLNLITGKPPAAVGQDAYEALRSLKSVRPESIKRLPNGNAITTWLQHSSEQGEAITLFWWHVASPVPPNHIGIANFSYTVLASQEHTAQTQSELQVLTKSIENAAFHPTGGQ